jgi:hypothetical protein
MSAYTSQLTYIYILAYSRYTIFVFDKKNRENITKTTLPVDGIWNIRSIYE